jgi:hypothetical protein
MTLGLGLIFEGLELHISDSSLYLLLAAVKDEEDVTGITHGLLSYDRYPLPLIGLTSLNPRVILDALNFSTEALASIRDEIDKLDPE